MDAEWAIAELQKFLDMTELHRRPPPPGTVGAGSVVTAQPSASIIPVAHVVEQILDRVTPDWQSRPGAIASNRWVPLREASQRALAQLQREDELREHLGDNAPRLDASHLHPWVWEGARSLWQSGHYGEAVQAASRKVNAEAQNKLARRDISETKLLQQAFSTEPAEPGRPRLRISVDDGSDTFKSLHVGAGAFSHGCYSALRNPGSHDVEAELPEEHGLERLAAFSILARWIDTAEVLR